MSMTPWASLIVVVKNTPLRAHHSNSDCATGTNKGVFALMPLPKWMSYLHYLKEQSTLLHLTSAVVTTTLNWTKSQSPKVLSQQYLASLNF